MAGEIKRMVDVIVQQRAHGDPLLERTTRTKLLIKGINPKRFTDTSEDDPIIIEKLKQLADVFGCVV